MTETTNDNRIDLVAYTIKILVTALVITPVAISLENGRWSLEFFFLCLLVGSMFAVLLGAVFLLGMVLASEKLKTDLNRKIFGCLLSAAIVFSALSLMNPKPIAVIIYCTVVGLAAFIYPIRRKTKNNIILS